MNRWFPAKISRFLTGNSDILCAILAAGLAFSRWQLWPFILITLLVAGWRIVRAKTAGQAFREGWWLWLGSFTLIIRWIEFVVRFYGGLPFPVSVVPLLLLAGYCALYPAAAGWLAVRLERWRGSRLFWWPFTMFGLEIAREHLLTGFGWGSPGYALTSSFLLRQAADLGGVYLLTFLLTALCALVLARKGIQAAILLLLWAGYGAIRPQFFPPPKRQLRVGVVQGDIDQWQKWSRSMVGRTVEIYTDQTRKLLAKGPLDLVVWPETAMPFYWQYRTKYRTKIEKMVKDSHIQLLTGVPASVYQGGQRQSRNRAILIGPDGKVEDHADKHHLVPFGEYVPLRPYLNFIDKLVEGVGDFSPGNDPGWLEGKKLKIGISICYEVLFAGESRDRLGDSDLLAVMTNDAWFGPTDAPYQLAAMGIMRVVENRVPMVRAANTGISMWVDLDGTAFEATPIFKRAAFRATIPLRRGFSLYRYTGAFVEGAAMLLALLGVLVFGPIAWLYRKKAK